MRFPSCFLFCSVLFAAGSLFAQQQEHTLEERIKHPDMGMTFDVRNSSGAGGRTFSANSARVKEYQGSTREFASRDYASKDFSGSKQSWFGKFKFATKETAPKGKFEIPNAGKKADLKEVSVKDAREASKVATQRELPDANRPFLGKEKAKLNVTPNENAQRSYANSQLVELKSIDDIRELLNKSK